MTSNINIIDIANKTKPENPLEEAAKEGAPQVLQLIEKNRKSAHQGLQKATENLQETLEKTREMMGGEPLFTIENNGKTFSLEDTLRDIEKGLGSTLTFLEASNSLLDMVVSDLGGLFQQLEQTQEVLLVANSHTQTLLELLKQKGVISEDEMKRMWDQLIAQAKTKSD